VREGLIVLGVDINKVEVLLEMIFLRIVREGERGRAVAHLVEVLKIGSLVVEIGEIEILKKNIQKRH